MASPAERHRHDATSLPNCPSVKPANGSIYFGSSAEITPPVPSQRTNRPTSYGTTSSNPYTDHGPNCPGSAYRFAQGALLGAF